jgi:hypothetical protein
MGKNSTHYGLFLAAFAFSFVFLINDAYSQERQFGAWTVGRNGNDSVYAKTTNDSNGKLGLICLKKDVKCYLALVIDSNCEHGKNYLTLMNPDAGNPSSLDLTCHKVKNENWYFLDLDKISDSVFDSPRLSFAFALQSGEYKVSRFLMNGSKEAIEALKKDWTIMKSGNTGTVDQKL